MYPGTIMARRVGNDLHAGRRWQNAAGWQDRAARGRLYGIVCGVVNYGRERLSMAGYSCPWQGVAVCDRTAKSVTVCVKVRQRSAVSGSPALSVGRVEGQNCRWTENGSFRWLSGIYVWHSRTVTRRPGQKLRQCLWSLWCIFPNFVASRTNKLLCVGFTQTKPFNICFI